MNAAGYTRKRAAKQALAAMRDAVEQVFDSPHARPDDDPVRGAWNVLIVILAVAADEDYGDLTPVAIEQRWREKFGRKS